MGYQVVTDTHLQAKIDAGQVVHPWDIMTAFKTDKFKMLEQVDLDYYKVGLSYTIQPEDYRKSNKGVLVML